MAQQRVRHKWGTFTFTFLGGSEGKESACNAGDTSSIPGSGSSPWRREQLLAPVFLPGKSHGRKSLVGYSPWGRKEADTTEMSTHARRTWTGNIRDEPGESCSAKSKKLLKQNKTHKKAASPHTQSWRYVKGTQTKLKEIPVAKAGKNCTTE